MCKNCSRYYINEMKLTPLFTITNEISLKKIRGCFNCIQTVHVCAYLYYVRMQIMKDPCTTL